MKQQERDNTIRTQLKQLGFKPRDDKDIDKYVSQLNIRLKKQNKHLYIYETNNNIVVKLEDSISARVNKTKSLFARVTDEEMEKYKKLAESRNTDLSKLIRDLLDRECDNE